MSVWRWQQRAHLLTAYHMLIQTSMTAWRLLDTKLHLQRTLSWRSLISSVATMPGTQNKLSYPNPNDVRDRRQRVALDLLLSGIGFTISVDVSWLFEACIAFRSLYDMYVSHHHSNTRTHTGDRPSKTWWTQTKATRWFQCFWMWMASGSMTTGDRYHIG